MKQLADCRGEGASHVETIGAPEGEARQAGHPR